MCGSSWTGFGGPLTWRELCCQQNTASGFLNLVSQILILNLVSQILTNASDEGHWCWSVFSGLTVQRIILEKPSLLQRLAAVRPAFLGEGFPFPQRCPLGEAVATEGIAQPFLENTEASLSSL